MRGQVESLIYREGEPLMLWLPELLFSGRGWRVPLAQASTSALVEALVLGPAEHVCARLAAAIERDPGLALWAVCRASLDGTPELRTPAALAGWLAESAIGLLDGLRAEAPADEADRSALLRAANAWLASASGGRQPPGDAAAEETRNPQHQARNADELHVASAAAAAARSDQGADAPRSPLPGWLQEAMHANAEQPGCLAEAALAERALTALVDKLSRLKRLETAFREQLEAEKLEAMAEFAAGAGHEINNPLAVIAGRAQLLLREERDPERCRELAVMNGQAMRVYEMIADMMLFARPPAPKPSECDVSLLIDKLLGELQAEAARRRVELGREGTRESLVIEADADQLSAALRALVENAIEALPGGGRVQVALRQVLATTSPVNGEANRELEIVVRDDGPGISPELRRRLFDPFFSGRGAGRGLGLGLSKCWRIVANHGGRIEVESEVDRGATFKIRLPAQVGGRKSEVGNRNEA